MKYVTILFFYFLSVNFYCQSDNEIYKSFIRIEVFMGGNNSIRLFKEGILCKSLDSNSVVVTKFLPISLIDVKYLIKLQNLLLKDNLFQSDTIVDDINVRYFGARKVDILLIKKNELINVEWVDGKNKQLEKMLNYLNQIIPIQCRRTFEIIPYWLR